MSTHSQPAVFHPHAARMALPGIRSVTFAQPFHWLRAGAQDLARTWPLSLFYGIAFAALGYIMVQAAESQPHLAGWLISGFLFVAPVLAVVFYCLSHRLEHHHKLPKLFVPLLSWRANPGSLAMFVAMLAFVLISWERISVILVGLFLNDSGLTLTELLSPAAVRQHADFFLIYLVAAFVLAIMIFSISVVSLPMMLHRKVDFATAIVTSFMATRLNFAVMLLWAALLAGLTFLGMAAHFIGMAVIFPLLGHASWHAYREMIERE